MARRQVDSAAKAQYLESLPVFAGVSGVNEQHSSLRQQLSPLLKTLTAELIEADQHGRRQAFPLHLSFAQYRQLC